MHRFGGSYYYHWSRQVLSNGLVGLIPKLRSSNWTFKALTCPAINSMVQSQMSLNSTTCGSFTSVSTNSLPAYPPRYTLSHLTHLYLDHCNMQSSVASSIGQLTDLQGLGLHGNFLTGSIPVSIGQLSDLSVFYMDTNAFSGIIPTEIRHVSP
jgi:hypothetical protein